jgi:hypothetical protein
MAKTPPIDNKTIRVLRKGRYATPRTMGMIHHITEEVINRHTGQFVLYFKPFVKQKGISIEGSKYDMYNESTDLRFLRPFPVPCLVEYSPITLNTETAGKLGWNKERTINIFIQRETLKKLDTFPNMGDVFSFDRGWYEVSMVDDTPLAHGSPFYKYAVTVSGTLIPRQKYASLLEPDVDREVSYFYENPDYYVDSGYFRYDDYSDY